MSLFLPFSQTAIDNFFCYGKSIVPPGNICNEITEFKEDFASRFASKEALKVIPHITLKAPFKLPATAHPKLVQWFQQMFVNGELFQIRLKNFGAFHNKYKPVVFVNPIMTEPLHILQKEIIRRFRIAFPALTIMDHDLEFNPHMTIAYRDLEASMFVKSWGEYKVKKYESIFEVNSFHLLQHDRKKWNIIDTYTLLK